VSAGEDKHLLLSAFVDELVRCGMRDACTSPGSRNTPLLLSLARDCRLRCHSHIDERCSGFYALGLAKASGLPVAVTCTSGTAVAELLPAAVEAYHARVPLLLLTADRPPELRDVGAGQTIDQARIFGSATKWFYEVDVDGIDASHLDTVRTLACRAYATAIEGRPGVVHLNFPLREPLIARQPPPPDPSGRPEGAPFVQRDRIVSTSAAAIAKLRELVLSARRGVVIAGRDERFAASGDGQGLAEHPTLAGAASAVEGRQPNLAAAAAAFCETQGWALLADPLSAARRGVGAIAHYDALLRDSGFAEQMQPDVVIRVGDLPTSKPLRTWLAGLESTRQIALDPEGAWQDPASVLWESLAVDPASALWKLTPEPTEPDTVAAEAAAALTGRDQAARDWLASWHSADERAAEAINATLASQDDVLSEPAVAAELGVLLPAEATLFVASSMPVRDIETFWPVREDPPRVLCNRGTNGIDGTVSAAFGAAAADLGPVTLLIGDVALAHDIGGLIAARRLDLKLTIVLLNNGGGGIFDFLPVAAATERDLYTEHVATPPGLDFADAAALYGLRHELAGDVPAFREALERAFASPQSTIVEVPGDRAANIALHREVWQAVAAAAQGGQPPGFAA
jgi:2-succinyl-5-enolpyruvyl-6-hydroxy-3-cyclohexene-1-carboxylate synthase